MKKLTLSNLDEVQGRIRPLDVIVFGRGGQPVTSGLAVPTKFLVHGRPLAGTMVQVAEHLHHGKGRVAPSLNLLSQRLEQFDQAWWLPLKSSLRATLKVEEALTSFTGLLGYWVPAEPQSWWQKLLKFPTVYNLREDGSELTFEFLHRSGVSVDGTNPRPNVEDLLAEDIFREDYCQIAGDSEYELPFSVTAQEEVTA